MKHVLSFVLVCALSTVSAAATEMAPLSPQLQALNEGVGTWVYHGKLLQSPYAKAGNWDWNEECSWSANRIDLVCSFDMHWPDSNDHSVALSTYNTLDKSYWHYEIIDDYKGDKPVVSRMSVTANTWTETSVSADINGKATQHYRVVYTFMSPTKVEVSFHISKDGVHWETLGSGVGIKQR